MMLRLPLAICLTLVLVSCSGPRSAKTDNAKTEPAGLEIADAAPEASIDMDDEAQFVEEDKIVDDQAFVEKKEMVEQELQSTAVSSPAMVAIDPNAQLKEYTVGENETLMLISFKIYGDYKKWRQIAKHNKDIIIDGQTVTSGMVIRYAPPVEDFVWTPSGDPYLIIWGDTLGKISKKVYKTMRRWKDIWHNNEPLIKDPNKIYAGFTIYYMPDSQNEVAFK